jgi:hypothetical protein
MLITTRGAPAAPPTSYSTSKKHFQYASGFCGRKHYKHKHKPRTLSRIPSQHPKPQLYGVSANGKWWAAKICYDSKQHYLGTFDTKQDAALAYDREARQRGEDRPLNYESIEAAEEAAA